MRADNTHHLTAAANRRRVETRARAEAAIADLRMQGTRVTVTTICRAARVSRSWLYTQPDLMRDVEQHIARNAATARPDAERASAQSLLRRLEVALQRNRELTADNQGLQRQIAVLLGEQRITAARSSNSHQTAAEPAAAAQSRSRS